MLAQNGRGGCSWTAVEDEPSHQYSNTFRCCVTNVSRGALWQNNSDMEMYMKQSCVIEFLHVETVAPIHIHWSFLNVYGDQTVHVSTVRLVVHFNSGDSDAKDKPYSRWPCTAVTSQNEKCLGQLMHRSVDYSQGTAYRAADQLQRTENDGGNIGTLQSLCQVSPMNTYMGTERTMCASFQDLLN